MMENLQWENLQPGNSYEGNLHYGGNSHKEDLQLDAQPETALEEAHLEETIQAAEEQLAQTRQAVEKRESEMMEAKEEIWGNTEHGVGSGNLGNAADFEALVELSQEAAMVTDMVADCEEMRRKIRRLEQVIGSPYFGRIDFLFEGETSPEPVYIGRTSLMEKNAARIYVYDWRSPIASVFYRFMTGEAYYDAPGGRITGQVERKRQYEIKDSRLHYFFDTDVNIRDEILKQLLSRNTSPQMKTIVETIQKEQDVVIRNMEDDLLLIQGVAGSGKTSIALHRAAYLMYQGLQSALSANNILILSPNATFEQYISNVLPELGEENVVSLVFEDILHTFLKEQEIQSREAFLEGAMAGGTRTQDIRRSMEYKTSMAFLEVLDRFVADIPLQDIPYRDISFQGGLVATGEELRRRLSQRPEVPLAVRLTQLEDWVLEKAFGTQKWKHKEDRNLILQELQTFTRLDVCGLYRRLWEAWICDAPGEGLAVVQSPADTTGRGGNLRTDLSRIRRDTLDMLDAGRLGFDDAIAVLYLHLRIYGNDAYRNIRQVIIDEAQDYYPLQFEIFRMLFPAAKYTVLGDVNQTLAKQEDLSFYGQVQKMLGKKKMSLITLDKSFRCTEEILQFGLQFVGHRPEIQCFNRPGDPVEVESVDGHEAYLDRILSKARECQDKGMGTVCLLCKTAKGAKRLYTELMTRMDLKLVEGSGAESIRGNLLMPSYLAKGLEFDAVILCDADARNYPAWEDGQILYISCTRALHRLILLCEGELTPLLKG